MAGSGRHLLFLSHAGVDTEAARVLVDRIEKSAEARSRGLRVWFGKRDLTGGTDWQNRIEQVIEHESTAFAVLVGKGGIVNWVESEVRVALSRARTEPDYPFIPIIGCDRNLEDVLPAFVRLYQGVRNVENDAAEFAKLLAAALRQTTARPQPVDDPFVGLRAFESADALLFFGRDRETDELLDAVRHNRLVMVVGDSGSGKSSLVKAGLVPRFRGGALAEPHADKRNGGPWHVVETRPGREPFEALADDLVLAARRFATSPETWARLREHVRSRAADKFRDALVDGSPEGARTLLVVDQFEELWTQCNEAARVAFVRALLRLADPARPSPVWVVLTMRSDYYNLCRTLPELHKYLEPPEDKHPRPKYTLRRIGEKGIEEAIAEPLRLADVDGSTALVKRVGQDIGDQPAQLTLVQVALNESWRRRREHNGRLLTAYVMIGGVAGALAHLAEEIFTTRLDGAERRAAESMFLRLVQLGDSGGTTRRVAARDEFSDDNWRLVQRFATFEFRRLVAMRGDGPAARAELCHEALVTQWPRYQKWLSAARIDKHIHDRVIAATRRWKEADHSGDCLLAGRDLEEALALRKARRQWLSPNEEALLGASEARRARERLQIGIVTGLAIVAVIVVALLWHRARAAENEATERQRKITAQQRMAELRQREDADRLVASHWSAGVAARDLRADPLTAAHYFARAADADGTRAWAHAVAAAEWAVRGGRLIGTLPSTGEVSDAVFAPAGARVLTRSDNAALVWDALASQPITPPYSTNKVSRVRPSMPRAGAS